MKQIDQIESVPDIRFIGRQAGKYILPTRQSASGLSAFACLTQSISLESVALSAPVIGDEGAKVIINVDEVGLVYGTVSRILDQGFVARVDREHNDLSKLGTRISWLKKRAKLGLTDSRSSKRFRPRSPHSSLLLSDGTLMDCFLIDISLSGVAVSADVNPKMGEPMAIGKLVGRVVRKFDAGFALEFLNSPDSALLEQMIEPCDQADFADTMQIMLTR